MNIFNRSLFKKILIGYAFFFLISFTSVWALGTYPPPVETPDDPPPVEIDSKWVLDWSDEFNGFQIDSAKWEHEVNGQGGGNNELQYYTDRADNSFVENGVLYIQAKKENYQGPDGQKQYTSARMRTLNKGDWKYGRVDVKAKLPFGQGLWPAIWMLPTDWVYGGWAASGEIDIMEAVNLKVGGNNNIHGTLHYGGEWPRNTSSGDSTTPANSVVDEYHVYSVEWEEKEIRWYIDGELYQSQNNWHSEAGDYPAPFNQKFHLILNVAVGGNWPGSPDDSTIFPQQMAVDYVRVYKLGTDDDDGGDDDNNNSDCPVWDISMRGNQATLNTCVKLNDGNCYNIIHIWGDGKPDQIWAYSPITCNDDGGDNGSDDGDNNSDCPVWDISMRGNQATLNTCVKLNDGNCYNIIHIWGDGKPEQSWAYSPITCNDNGGDDGNDDGDDDPNDPCDGTSPYNGIIASVPGKIEAEYYDVGCDEVAYSDTDAENVGGEFRNDSVDIAAATDAGNGYYIGWLHDGEWIKYTINVAKAGFYDIAVRLSSAGNGSVMHLSIDGSDITGAFNIAPTGGWQSWRTDTINGIELPAGKHTLTLHIDNGDFNVNYFNINEVNNEPPSGPLTANKNRGEWTLVTVSDTQHYSQNLDKAPIYNMQQAFDWLVSVKDQLNIKLVQGLGDITENWNNGWEWDNSTSAWNKLYGQIPFMPIMGNHDEPWAMNQYFPVSNFSNEPWWGGDFGGIENNYLLFTIGREEYLFLQVEPYDQYSEYRPAGIEWAKGVLASNPDKKVILATHALSGTQHINDQLLKKYDNIVMANAGHDCIRELNYTTNGPAGGLSHNFITDYQCDDYEVMLLRYYKFKPLEDKVEYYTYSPITKQFETDANSQGSFTLIQAD